MQDAAAAQRLMARETQVRRGSVPDRLDGLAVPRGTHRLSGSTFLLRGRGLACLYRRGEGITAELDDPAEAGSLELFLSGTVHSAVAALAGLMPLHASAVVVGGAGRGPDSKGAIAFAGPAGAGKSTTVAGLAARGFPLFADDTLVLDPTHRPPVCLPGHKRLKLWPDALALTGARQGELVAEDYAKYFADVPADRSGQPLPLRAIVVLEAGDEPALFPVRGAARIALLDDDHYTAQLHALANGHGRAERLALLARLGESIGVWRFVRPLAPDHFDETLDFLAARLPDLAG